MLASLPEDHVICAYSAYDQVCPPPPPLPSPALLSSRPHPPRCLLWQQAVTDRRAARRCCTWCERTRRRSSRWLQRKRSCRASYMTWNAYVRSRVSVRTATKHPREAISRRERWSWDARGSFAWLL